MNRLGRAVLNSPARATAQRRWVVPVFGVLGGDLRGCRVLEIGCGCGVGSELLLDVLGAEEVRSIDVDPSMVRLARRRLLGRAEVHHGDMVDTGVVSGSFDAVVDMGAMHLEPRWREAIGEVRRVLRPGGRLYFEEIVAPVRQRLSVLATGRGVDVGFTRAALLDRLEEVGLEVVGLRAAGPASFTGVVGDLVGVAAKPS